MKFLKISMILSAFALFLAFGCQKTAEQLTPVFVEKTFYPTGEEDAKARMTTFLDAVEVQKKGVASRTIFQDMEVNEGRWTLEGAANYEKNVNIGSGDEGQVETFTLSVDNFDDGGVVKMIGSDMTAKYSSLLGDINLEEATSGRLASIVDMKITTVSTSKTDLEIKVVFEDDVSSGGGIPWNTAASGLTSLLSAQLFSQQSGCAPWMPDADIILIPGSLCYTNSAGSEYCMQSRIIDNFLPQPMYSPADYPADMATAMTIANGWKSDWVNANFPPPTAPQFPYSVKVVGVSTYTEIVDVPHLPNEDYLYQHFVSYLIVGQFQYCY